MEQPLFNFAEQEDLRLSDGAFTCIALGFAFLGYFTTLLVTGDEGPQDALIGSLRNLLPLTIVSLAARAAILRWLMDRPLAVQLPGHILFATLYTMVFYWLLMVLIGVAQGNSFTEFVVRAFFPGPAIAWQLLQGMTLYALVAALTYLRARPPLPSFVVVPEPTPALAPKDQGPSRYFIRKGEDIHPIEVSAIVSITGADDYAEVATLQGRHLVKMRLSEFEKTLEGDNFIRVHRSHIVNVDRIARAEPAGGGRMLLHMENGEMIQASRAGSRLLRERII